MRVWAAVSWPPPSTPPGLPRTIQPLIVQLDGPLQAQFAGYYVADYQGFYDEAEVAVTLIPGTEDVDITPAVAAGIANLVIERMPEALAAASTGRTWSISASFSPAGARGGLPQGQRRQRTRRSPRPQARPVDRREPASPCSPGSAGRA